MMVTAEIATGAIMVFSYRSHLAVAETSWDGIATSIDETFSFGGDSMHLFSCNIRAS